MASNVSELAYETAVASLRRQEEELNQLRQRTGMLLAAGSLVASFLGAETLGRQGTGAWTALAVIAFFLSAATCIYLLAPKSGLGFSVSGSQLYREFEGHGSNLDPVYVQLAEWLQGAWNDNQDKLDGMNRIFAFSSAMLVLEMFFWVMALRGRIPVAI
jgi:hypothetical protein